MTQCLFYCGKGHDAGSAMRDALFQCADLLLTYPSLVVECVEITPDAHHVDAHIRVMALADQTSGTAHSKKDGPHADAKPTGPQDILHEQAEEWIPEGIDPHNFLNPAKFEVAAMSGVIPDVPTQDMNSAIALHLTPEEARVRAHVLENDEKLRERLKPEPE